ncbi:MAG: diguanylate cyclase [Planctomycetota bacterium]
MQEDLAKLVYKDELTDLYNRRFLYSYLNKVLQSIDSHKFVSLMMMDIDFFKNVNDTYGHLEGDNLLKQLGEIIKSLTGQDEVPIRYAGDEFTVILPGKGKAEAAKFAEALREKVSSSVFKRRDANAEPMRIGISIGIATAPEDGGQPEALIEEADKALYYSKRSGRNRVSQAHSFTEASIVGRSVFDNFPCPKYIGRVQVLTEITEFIMSQAEGSNTFISLVGPPGIGKSRLLSELEKSGGNNFLGLKTVCSETDRHSPYKTIIGLIKKTEMPFDMALNKESTEQDRKKLFDSITARILDISAHRPLVLLIDEFQNIDDGSLEVINFLYESSKGRVVVVASIRGDIFSNIGSTAPAVNDLLAELSASPKFKEIMLEPLGPDEVSLMISHILTGRPDMPELDRRVYEATGGNPLFVEELMKSFISKKYIKNEGSKWQVTMEAISELDLHIDLERVIASNIGMMESDTRQVVARATVVGKDLDLSVLAGVGHQGESETQDAIDKATKMKIIAPVEPGNTDKFTFVSQRVQEAVYKNIEDAERQNIHNEVGEVTERLYQDDPDKVAGVLAFHYEKAGQDEKATKFTQIAENTATRTFQRGEAQAYYDHKNSIVRSRIPEAVHPLNSQQMNDMKDVLRGLITAGKNMRLYPEGSQLITMSTSGLIRMMNKILAEVNTFTFTEAKNDLQINTVPADMKAFGTGASEFLGLMKQHYIKSCTFRKGVTSAEVETLLRNLDDSKDKQFSMAGYWNKFLEERAIGNIGITQRAFVAVKDKGASGAGVSAQEKVLITEQNAPQFRDLLRYFCAAVENIKLYPPGSQLTVEAVISVNRALDVIFQNVSMLNFSVVEDNLLVNGAPVHSRLLGSAAITMAIIIRDNDLKSILILKSITAPELEKFLTSLSNLSPERKVTAAEWNEMLNQQGITSIKIGAISYSVANARRGGAYKAPTQPPAQMSTMSEPVFDSADGPAMAGPRPQRPAKEEDIATKIARLVNAAPERLMNDEVVALLEKMAENNDADNFDRLAGRIMQNMRQAKPELRSQAYSFYLQMLNKTKVNAHSLLFKQGVSHILEGLAVEKENKVYPLIIEAASRHCLYHLERGEYQPVIDIVGTVGRRLKDEPELSGLTDEMRSKMEEFFANIKGSPAFQGILNNFLGGDDALHGQSKVILINMGSVVLPELVQFLKKNEEPGPREEIISVMNTIGPESNRIFLNEFRNTADEGDANNIRRMVEVMPLIYAVAPPEIQGGLEETMNTLVRKEGIVRDSVFNTIKKLEKGVALKMLIPLLSDKDKKVVIEAMDTAASSGYTEISAALIGMFGTETNAEILKECCMALGKLKDEKAVPVLIDMLKQKRFLGFFGGVSDEVRGACAWALGHFKSMEAQDVLKEALNDRSPSVRSAARLGLKEAEK